MDDDFDVVRGSGNVFADLGDPEAVTKHLKAQAAAQIIGQLNARQLTIRAGAALARVDAADIQRIRNADLSRFTLDRLLRIASRLGQMAELRFKATSPDQAA